MEATVLSWTRVERPPSGFAPGRVLVLVACADGVQRYALWVGRGEPAVEATVTLAEAEGLWRAG